MYIRLGNLTVQQFAERVGATFTDEEAATLEVHRSDKAQLTDPSKFHIFEDPALSITIGSDAAKSVLPIFQAADARTQFNQSVPFYPIQENN